MKPSYIGIDYKTTEFSVAEVNEKELLSAITLLYPKTNLTKLAWMQHSASRFASSRDLSAITWDGHGGHVPQLVVIEQPGGRTVPKAMLNHEGVLLASFGLHFATTEVPIPTWRKAVLGSGNADKADAVAYILDRYGVELIHDEAEAACLAVYGMENSS
jgi:hypothetical protein